MNRINEEMWHSPIKDWELVDDKIYNIVLSESEKTLKEAITNAESVTNKSYTMINILVLSVGVILSYLIGHVNNLPHTVLYWAVLMLLIPAFICFYKCYTLIGKRGMNRNGTEPKELLIPEYIENGDYNENDKRRVLLKHIIEQNQDKIKNIDKDNEKRINKYQSVIDILLFSFIGIILVLIYSIIC